MQCTNSLILKTNIIKLYTNFFLLKIHVPTYKQFILVLNLWEIESNAILLVVFINTVDIHLRKNDFFVC